MADTDLERDEESKFRKARDQRMSENIAREWAGAGHYRRQHLKDITAAGDKSVLEAMFRREESVSRIEFPNWMAMQDMWEIATELDKLAARKKSPGTWTGGLSRSSSWP